MAVAVVKESSVPQEVFFAKVENKMCLIALLPRHLKLTGTAVHQASREADTLIESTSVEMSRRGVTSIVVGGYSPSDPLCLSLSDPQTDVQPLHHLE